MTLPLFPTEEPLVNQLPINPDAVFNQPPDPALLNLPDVSYSLINSIGNLRKLLPPTWFADNDPVLDAILAGYADTTNDIQVRNEWAYQQDRLATATGIWLDMYAEDFFGVGGQFPDAGYMYRRINEADGPFRSRLQAELLTQRATRYGMEHALETWTNVIPTIIEPWNPNDTGVWDGTFAFYDQQGYWGSTNDPYITFIITSRAGGVPLQTWNDETQIQFQAVIPGMIGGVSVQNTNYLFGGYDSGVIAWIDGSFNQSIITDQMVYDCINRTKPAGTKVFIHLTDSQQLPNNPDTETFDLLDYNFILNVSQLADQTDEIVNAGNQVVLGSTFILGASQLGVTNDNLTQGPPVGYFNSFLDVNFVLNQSFLADSLNQVSSSPPIFAGKPGALGGPNSPPQLPFVLGGSILL